MPEMLLNDASRELSFVFAESAERSVISFSLTDRVSRVETVLSASRDEMLLLLRFSSSRFVSFPTEVISEISLLLSMSFSSVSADFSITEMSEIPVDERSRVLSIVQFERPSADSRGLSAPKKCSR